MCYVNVIINPWRDEPGYQQKHVKSNNAYFLGCYQIRKRMRDDVNWYCIIIMWKYNSVFLWYSSFQGHIIVVVAIR